MPVKPVQTRTFRGRSPDERRAERRERFIEAGISAFGARGYVLKHAAGTELVDAIRTAVGTPRPTARSIGFSSSQAP